MSLPLSGSLAQEGGTAVVSAPLSQRVPRAASHKGDSTVDMEVIATTIITTPTTVVTSVQNDVLVEPTMEDMDVVEELCATDALEESAVNDYGL